MFLILKRIALSMLALAFLAWIVSYLAMHFEEHEYTQITDQQRAQAQAYLEGKITPTPKAWKWSVFTPEEGVELRTGSIDAPNGRGTVLFVPGFTGTIDSSMNTITKLHQAGYRVAAIEYRGQGKSYRPLENPEKGYVEDFAILANDLAKFARQIKRDQEPLFFFSVSKGAHITLRMAAQHELGVQAYALIVPMVKINTQPFNYRFIEVSANILERLGLGPMYAPGQSQWPPKPLIFGEANGCNSNPKTAQLQSAMFALDESIRTRGTTIKWLKESMNSTKRLLSNGFLEKLNQPVKVFTAGDDLLVDTGAAKQLCQSLANCEVSNFPYAKHCINRESEERMNTIIRQSIELFENSTRVSNTVDPA